MAAVARVSDGEGARTFLRMTAEPTLRLVARLLARHTFDAVLIGNAAAALRGAPVTTLDLDFMYRRTPAAERKLRAMARELEATILTPYYPVSDLLRIVRDNAAVQLDFMAKVHGIRRYGSLQARATPMRFGEHTLLVATLDDVIRSKTAAARPQDLAVLPVLERARDLQA
jgi:hypothetical protein